MDIKQNPTYIKLLELAQDLDELGGVSSTEEYIAIMDELSTELRARSIRARANHLQAGIGQDLRDKMVEQLCYAVRDLDSDTADLYEAGANFIGWTDMSDEELIHEYSHYVREEDELITQAIANFETHKMLKG